jgi:hypothetical protein
MSGSLGRGVGVPVVFALLVVLAGAGCGSESCPAGETPEDTIITDTHCGGSVGAPPSLHLPPTIPDQCGTGAAAPLCPPNDCLATSSPCSQVCLEVDPLRVNIGLTGLPFAGPVSLPDLRVELATAGAPLPIASGTISATQKGASISATFDLTFTKADGSTVSITSGTYSTAVHHATECGPI